MNEIGLDAGYEVPKSVGEGPGKPEHRFTHEEIADVAYDVFLERTELGGEYFGDSSEDWFEAERILKHKHRFGE